MDLDWIDWPPPGLGRKFSRPIEAFDPTQTKSTRFAEGEITEPTPATAVAGADRETQAAFPCRSAPDARGYAASAAVDVSSVGPRTAANVLSAASCAASAAARAWAEADELHYDEVFEFVRRAESVAQASLTDVGSLPQGLKPPPGVAAARGELLDTEHLGRQWPPGYVGTWPTGPSG
jgi:hypothetical protein